jgi:hypothetical protein
LKESANILLTFCIIICHERFISLIQNKLRLYFVIIIDKRILRSLWLISLTIINLSKHPFMGQWFCIICLTFNASIVSISETNISLGFQLPWVYRTHYKLCPCWSSQTIILKEGARRYCTSYWIKSFEKARIASTKI